MPFEPELPFEGSRSRIRQSPVPRRRRLPVLARESGHRVVREHAGRQAERVLEYLRVNGPATDHQIAAHLGIALASVNSTRYGLVERHLVREVDLVEGEFGALRTRWGVVETEHDASGEGESSK